MSQQVIPTLNEHAGRIRGIEKYIWIAFGGLGVLGSVISVIVAFFKH